MANGTLKVSNIQTSSGSGTITLGQSGETVTIPSGCTFTNSGTATGFGGITVADQFRMTANNATDADITSNIERVDTSGQGGITDNQMSESSGIFTFPLTGIYLVKFNVALACSNAGGMTFRIMVTTNNSSFVDAAFSGLGLRGDQETNGEINSLIDVTDTSNVKVKFNFNNFSGSSNTARGDTGENQTYFTFIRLADT